MDYFAFRFYIANVGNFNKMYGSIGAVIVLLLWFYLARRAAALDVSLATHDAR